jgi:hypothetical protein
MVILSCEGSAIKSTVTIMAKGIKILLNILVDILYGNAARPSLEIS